MSSDCNLPLSLYLTHVVFLFIHLHGMMQFYVHGQIQVSTCRQQRHTVGMPKASRTQLTPPCDHKAGTEV